MDTRRVDKPRDVGRPGVLMLNFGEPESYGLFEVTEFLERIFAANPMLGSGSRELAAARAPGLRKAYRTIGGSPLNRQAAGQASRLAAVLAGRGLEASVVAGMQFTGPTVTEALELLRDQGVETVVAFPVYPFCGPSTTLRALDQTREALNHLGWNPDLREIAGWHRHPEYVRWRADSLRTAASAAGLDMTDPGMRVVFSAHGTPLRYVRAGSRYAEYVEQWCRIQANELELLRFTLGYQNHGNRPIEWTSPSIERAVAGLAAEDGEVTAVLVDPVSFVHEQSETLMELDIELREVAEEAGLEFHRVPVAHDAQRLIDTLADLVEKAVCLPDPLRGGTAMPRPCRCRPGAICLS